mgnify:CR=1 FL=1
MRLCAMGACSTHRPRGGLAAWDMRGPCVGALRPLYQASVRAGELASRNGQRNTGVRDPLFLCSLLYVVEMRTVTVSNGVMDIRTPGYQRTSDVQ